MRLRQATIEDHKAILQVAKQSPYTKDFSNQIMFSSEAAYNKGWIRVAYFDIVEHVENYGKIVGFTCVRHKIRVPETVLYFIGVDKEHQGKDIGTILFHDLITQSPHKKLALNVMKENKQARDFYARHNFVEEGESLKGEGVRLSICW